MESHRNAGLVPKSSLGGGKVMGGNRGMLGPYASALAKGANIGPSAHFSSSAARQQIILEDNGLEDDDAGARLAVSRLS